MNTNEFLLNMNRTNGAKGADGARGAKAERRQRGGRRGEGSARRRDGVEKERRGEGAARRRGGKMRGGLNWQHGEGRESIYKTI